MSSGAQKIPVWDQQPNKKLNTFYTSPATQYGRILVKQNYDYHYKWVGRATASTDCRTSEDVLKQLRFLEENPRWKPSKDSQYLKQEQDLWMDRLIKTAKPAIDNTTSAHVLRYAAFRRANPTGRPPIVERYVQKKLRKNHIDNLKRMTAAVDNSPPARAMQHHEQCLRQPYTRTGVRKRPKSQQSSRRTLQRQQTWNLQHPSLFDAGNLSHEQCLPGRRPTTAETDPMMSRDDNSVKNVRRERAHMPLERLHETHQMRSAGSDGVHLPISAAREALEGHARELGGARHSLLEEATTYQDSTMRTAARWPPDTPEKGDNVDVGAAASSARSPTQAALTAHRQWLATAPTGTRHVQGNSSNTQGNVGFQTPGSPLIAIEDSASPSGCVADDDVAEDTELSVNEDIT